MESIYAYELSERALKNYEILATLENSGDKNVYPSTALISAMLFSVVALNEKAFRTTHDIPLPSDIRTWKWPNEVTEYITSDSKFILFLDALRNSVAHSDFKFLVEETTKIVKGVSFSIKMDNTSITLAFFEADLLNLLKNFTKLYKNYNFECATDSL